MYMNVIVLGVAVVIAYFTTLYIAEPYLSKQTGRLLQYSANLWLTLGGIALLAGYHQSQKDWCPLSTVVPSISPAI